MCVGGVSSDGSSINFMSVVTPWFSSGAGGGGGSRGNNSDDDLDDDDLMGEG